MEYTAAERVALARRPGRPGTADYINALFTDFFEQKGDRLCREDASILGGIALFHGRPVTVIGHRKGKNLEENMKCNFGMPSPEGYRKAQRLMRAAEKFRRPIITCRYTRRLPRLRGRGARPRRSDCAVPGCDE